MKAYLEQKQQNIPDSELTTPPEILKNITQRKIRRFEKRYTEKPDIRSEHEESSQSCSSSDQDSVMDNSSASASPSTMPNMGLYHQPDPANSYGSQGFSYTYPASPASLCA